MMPEEEENIVETRQTSFNPRHFIIDHSMRPRDKTPNGFCLYFKTYYEKLPNDKKNSVKQELSKLNVLKEETVNLRRTKNPSLSNPNPNKKFVKYNNQGHCRVYEIPPWMLNLNHKTLSKKIKINFKPTIWIPIDVKRLNSLIKNKNNIFSYEEIFIARKMLAIANKFNNKFPYRLKKETCSTGRMKSFRVFGICFENIPKRVRRETLGNNWVEDDIEKTNMTTLFHIGKKYWKKSKIKAIKTFFKRNRHNILKPIEKEIANSMSCGKRYMEEELDLIISEYGKELYYLHNLKKEIRHCITLGISLMPKTRKGFLLNASNKKIHKSEPFPRKCAHFLQGIERIVYDKLSKEQNNSIYLYDAVLRKRKKLNKKIKINIYDIEFEYKIKRTKFDGLLKQERKEKEEITKAKKKNGIRFLNPETRIERRRQTPLDRISIKESIYSKSSLVPNNELNIYKLGNIKDDELTEQGEVMFNEIDSLIDVYDGKIKWWNETIDKNEVPNFLKKEKNWRITACCIRKAHRKNKLRLMRLRKELDSI